MSVTFYLDGGDRVRARLDQLSRDVQNFDQPLARVGLAIRDFAVLNIKSQGGSQPWIPNKRGGHTGIDTGSMWQSIGISQTSRFDVQVGTNVKYAKWFQEGTGIFAGHSTWTIKPVNARALAWSVGGEKYFSAGPIVMQGQPARPFLYIDDAVAAKIGRLFSEYLGLNP